MKTLLQLFLITLLVSSSFPMNREMQVRVTNRHNMPQERDVWLYRTTDLNNYYRYAKSFGGSVWHWDNPNCNIACDINGNDTQPPSWDPIIPGNYYLRVENRYVFLQIYPDYEESIDFVVIYMVENGVFSLEGNPYVSIGTQGNWPPTPQVYVSMNGPSEVYHPGKGNPPNSYTWTASGSGGTPPYTYTWYRNNYLAGTGPSYSISLGYDGVYPPLQWTLRVNIKDSSVPDKFNSASKLITEYSASGPIDPKAGAAGESITLPDEFSLQQNYPNPFNPETEIAFSLPEQASVKITVLDILGREVLLLEDGIIPAGNHKRTWKGINTAGNKVGSGIYLYRFTAKGESGKEFVSVKKMLMTK